MNTELKNIIIEFGVTNPKIINLLERAYNRNDRVTIGTICESFLFDEYTVAQKLNVLQHTTKH